jgi:hypothetical protein
MKYTAEKLQAEITGGFLDLYDSDFSDRDMHLLQELTGLQSLDLSYTQVTPKQIALLKTSLPEIAIRH